MLTHALSADSQGNFEAAYGFYERGIAYYLEVRLVNEKNSSSQAYIRQACQEHLKRAEVLKSYITARNTATKALERANNCYLQVDYSSAYPSFMEGIESLLESSRLIKPSHPQLSQTILGEVAHHMSHAEDAARYIRNSTSSNAPVQVSSSIDEGPPLPQVHASCCSIDKPVQNECPVEEDKLISTTSYSSAIDRNSTLSVESCSSAEIEVRALLVQQRVVALLTESNLLVDYLKIDSHNQEKIQELEDVSSQMSSLLEETDGSAGFDRLVIGEHSADRETLETAIEKCQGFLSAPEEISDSDNDNKHKQGNNSSSDEKEVRECLICFENAAVMATVPCGHKILCQGCVDEIGEKLQSCYICKAVLKEPKCIRIFD